MGSKWGGILLICGIAVVCVVAFYYPSFNQSNTLNENQFNTSNSSNSNNTTQSMNPLNNNLLVTNVAGISTITYESTENTQPQPPPTPSYLDTVLSAFNSYVENLYPQTGIPGAAIVVVKDGKIVYLKCMGVKEVGNPDPVNEDTLFQIASTTKAFTSANIAQLVDMGILNWNTKVREYFTPEEFQLYNSTIADEVTIADLLSHRCGLPEYAGDELMLNFDYKFYENLYRIRYAGNDSVFRTKWEYNDILYELAGECALRAAKKAGLGYNSWDEMITEMLLEPLQMNSATTYFSEYLSSPNHVHTYMHINGTLTEYGPNKNVAEAAGSGAISSSIKDMANWLEFQLALGNFQGTQLVSSPNLAETTKIHINITSLQGYGYGWNNISIASVTMIAHAGEAVPGKAMVTFFPELNMGIVSCANEGTYGSAFNNALAYSLLQFYRNGHIVVDTWPIYKSEADIKANSTAGKLPNPPSPPEPAKDLSTYLGIYANNFYGNINVTSSGGKLVLYLGDSNDPTNLEHWSGDVFKIVSSYPESYNTAVNFTSIDGSGKAQQVKLDYYDLPGQNGTFNRTS